MATLIPFISAYVNERKALGAFTGATPGAIRQRLYSFSKWFGNRSLDRFTTGAVKKWMGSLERLSVNSRSAYLSALRGFSKWLAAEGTLAYDPCSTIDAPRRPKRAPRALAHDQVSACLRCCQDDRERVIIMLAVGVGMRRAEIAGARWADYDRAKRTIHIVGKGSNERVVPVPSEVAAALGRLRGQLHDPIIANYVRGPHEPLSLRRISQIVDRIMRDAGVKFAAYDGAGLHSFRHTAASDVLDRCADVTIVQRMLGHANLTTTAVYLRAARLGDVAAAMEGRDYDGPADLPMAA